MAMRMQFLHKRSVNPLNTTWKKRLSFLSCAAVILSMLTAAGCQQDKPVDNLGDTTPSEITIGETEPEESVPAPIVDENAEELTEPIITEAEVTPAPEETEPAESSSDTTAAETEAETKPADTTKNETDKPADTTKDETDKPADTTVPAAADKGNGNLWIYVVAGVVIVVAAVVIVVALKKKK